MIITALVFIAIIVIAVIARQNADKAVLASDSMVTYISRCGTIQSTMKLSEAQDIAGMPHSNVPPMDLEIQGDSYRLLKISGMRIVNDHNGPTQ